MRERRAPAEREEQRDDGMQRKEAGDQRDRANQPVRGDRKLVCVQFQADQPIEHARIGVVRREAIGATIGQVDEHHRCQCDAQQRQRAPIDAQCVLHTTQHALAHCRTHFFLVPSNIFLWREIQYSSVYSNRP